MELVFYDFWRSSAAYRVRIALNIKGVDFRGVEIDLPRGEQRDEGYLAINPQGLVPALAVNGEVLSQSLAIIEWLDSRFPEPRLIPADPFDRARVMAQAQAIACDIHPINNLRVQNYLRDDLGASDEAVTRWIHHWITTGFDTLEDAAPDEGFLGGDAPGLADVLLVPQVYSARRFGMQTDPWPRLSRIDAACCALEPFAQAAPEAVRPQ